VLVVDDNVTNREILEHHVSAGGMRTASAVDGVDGLEQLRRAARESDAFALAVVDMKMPNMDGIELAAALHADPVLKNTRVVLVTSLHSPDELRRARQAGIQAYLSKPVRRSDLFRAMAQALGENADTPAQPTQTLPRFRARVLLAEDNGVNQVVARHMLDALGCEFLIVPNGRDAIEAVRSGGYDVVLMDCQMPVLDGQAATRAIRALEVEHERLTGVAMHVPVVALTANALAGDAEACFAAGMDDHLAKPYTRRQLAAKLARWLPERCVEEVSVDAVAAAFEALDVGGADGQSVTLDRAALDNVRAVDGIGAVLAEVIELYLDDAPAHLRALRTALEGGRLGDLGTAAHALKSASLNVGARALCDLCNRLERQAKAGTSAGTAEMVTGIEALMERVRNALRVELATLAQRGPARSEVPGAGEASTLTGAAA
jgi:CheY-like chemotaxis protein/HPt (histidine-containing phosphotransfer) domain-containing protein